MNYTYRPIGIDWHGERIKWSLRKRSPFRASWSRTLIELNRELHALSAKDVIIQLDLKEAAIRTDGMVRADARPASPAVILSFNSKHGPLRYQCDTFEGGAEGWQDNMRAIVLGLESLRQVDRYGITKRGEQYSGWKALPSGTMTRDEAERFVWDVAAPHGANLSNVAESSWPHLYRRAAQKLHPDHGGDRGPWDRLQSAKVALGL